MGQQDGLDPVVVASVVGRVKHDPNLVERLAAEAMERQGRDAHASGLLAGLKRDDRRRRVGSFLEAGVEVQNGNECAGQNRFEDPDRSCALSSERVCSRKRMALIQ